MKLLDVKIDGNLDAKRARNVITTRSVMERLTYCYEKDLLAKSDLAGTMTANVDIDEKGAVTDSTSSGLDYEYTNDCVAGYLRTAAFPKPVAARRRSR